MTPKIEIFNQNYAHFSAFEGSFLTNLAPKTPFLGTFGFFINFMVNYLYSLLPIPGARLWGPAKPYTPVCGANWLEFRKSPPLRRIRKRPTYWMVGWLGGWVGGAYLPLRNFFWQKIELFFFFFFKCL